MKRYLSLFLALILALLLLSSCQDSLPEEGGDLAQGSGSSIQSDSNLDNQDIIDTLLPNENEAATELRNKKVSIDLDEHYIGGDLKIEDKTDETKFENGYICKNENGCLYIAYAPNIYSYTVLIKYTDNQNEVAGVIQGVLKKHFYESKEAYTKIDTQILWDNQILITFPDFDSYFSCQEELLDSLSASSYVEKIHISYINSQNGTNKINAPYEIYSTLNSYYSMRYEGSILCKTYSEFTNACGSAYATDEGLKRITKSTFVNNYVFIVVNNHYREVEISDARLVGNTVYFTNNEYADNGAHPDIAYFNACVIVVPREELGKLPENTCVKTVDAPIYIEGTAELYDKGDALTIAFEHFYENYETSLPDGFVFTADVSEDAYYWFISIYPKYVGAMYYEEEAFPDIINDGADYTVSKLNGSIVYVSPSSPEKIYETALQLNYIFWYQRFAPTNEELATLVVNNGFLEDGFESVILPEDIVAGDIITIKTTGEWLNNQVYLLSHWSLKGEVLHSNVTYARVIHLEGEDFNITKIKEGYDFSDDKVILDRQGRFISLDEYTGNEIYLVADQNRLATYTGEGKYPIACMLAYNPRDIEAGHPPKIEHNITEEQAIKIASDHFYERYANLESYTYTVSVSRGYEDYFVIHIDSEPIKSGEYIDRAYIYTIHKGTGEITLIEIAE